MSPRGGELVGREPVSSACEMQLTSWLQSLSHDSHFHLWVWVYLSLPVHIVSIIHFIVGDAGSDTYSEGCLTFSIYKFSVAYNFVKQTAQARI